jgi:hypothetical protein
MLTCSDNQVRLWGFFRGGFMKQLAAMIFFAMVSGNAMAQAGGASSGTGAGSAGSAAAGATAGTVATVAAVVAGVAAASATSGTTSNH